MSQPDKEARKARDVLTVGLRFIGDTPEDAAAWTLTRPQVQAAATIQKYQGENYEVNALARELSDQVAAVHRGDLRRTEAMLIAQAHTLDELFNNLARRSHSNVDAGYIDAGETYLRLALKAQGQCRATLETLATIKNPPVFAKQANIANGPQQVNNGVAPAVDSERSAQAPPRGKKSIRANKLLEQTHGQPGGGVDTRAATAAARGHPAVEAVEAVHRAKKPRG